MTKGILGIDIAKLTYSASLVIDGKHYHHSFKNHPDCFADLMAWLDKHQAGEVHACMEATGRYWEDIAIFIHNAGYSVSVVNPMKISSYAKCKLARNKTDELDADLIADYCASQKPQNWTPMPPEVRELQALERHLQALKAMHSQENNRLQSKNPSDEVKSLIREHMAFIEQQITSMERKILDQIKKHQDLQHQRDLLITIPGVGKSTAAKLLGENVQSFTSGRDLSAHAGLSPYIRLSGTSVHRKPHISKIGNAHIRRSLYFPAIVAMRYNPTIIAFCERLRMREKHNKVIIGAAMHKLLLLAHGVLKSEIPYDPNYTYC